MIARKPAWLRAPLSTGPDYRRVAAAVSDNALHTVCGEARCPNRAECWSGGSATFLILGGVCTRGCAFCAVTRGETGEPADSGEALRVADAASRMGLRYAVVTSVTRDDLPDGGASLFAATVRALHSLGMRVEVLTPDYASDALASVLSAQPEVFAHNLETVPRLSPVLRHPRFSARRSLQTLEEAKRLAPGQIIKSSLLLGLGEEEDEILDTLGSMRDAGVDLLVLGQYLRPSARHAPVARYLPPDVFHHFKDVALGMGFRAVHAEPLARASHRAAELHDQALSQNAGSFPV